MSQISRTRAWESSHIQVYPTLLPGLLFCVTPFSCRSLLWTVKTQPRLARSDGVVQIGRLLLVVNRIIFKTPYIVSSTQAKAHKKNISFFFLIFILCVTTSQRVLGENWVHKEWMHCSRSEILLKSSRDHSCLLFHLKCLELVAFCENFNLQF